MGVGYTLAHQFLAQLSPAMRASVLANTRSRVCFQLATDDAGVIARSHVELIPEDFTSLDRYEVYASLFARGQVTPFASGRTLPAPAVTTTADKQRACSRQRYGVAREIVEREFSDLLSTSGKRATGSETPLGKSRRRSA
jgi:hypothetical protein